MCKRLNEDFLISDPDYKSVIEDTVFPDLESRKEDHILYGKDHLPLFCSVFHADDPCGTVEKSASGVTRRAGDEHDFDASLRIT